MRRKQKKDATPTVRCAVYTRKSTEEGLDQDFNTLDAQRESGEAYIKSQQHEGWRAYLTITTMAVSQVGTWTARLCAV
jgi:site-specific DNA recombinase